jgi:hypothetical protein
MTPRALHEQIGLPAHNAPGRAHLAWLLDSFVYADIDAMSLPQRHALRRALQSAISIGTSFEWMAVETYESADGAASFTGSQEEIRAGLADQLRQGLIRPADPTADLREAQVSAKEAAELLARGVHYILRSGAEPDEDVEGNAVVRPLRISSVVVCALPVNTYICVPLADAVVRTILMAMSATDSSVIRRCPYSLPDGRECGRVFVAVRTQKWCRPHGLVTRREQNRAALEKHRKKAAKKAKKRK